jgi:hypothetical protein
MSELSYFVSEIYNTLYLLKFIEFLSLLGQGYSTYKLPKYLAGINEIV